MDLGSLTGLGLAALLMVAAVMLSGASPTSFVDGPSLLVVFGGAIAALLVSFPWRQCRQVPRIVRKCLFSREPDDAAVARQLVRLAEIARREGLLSLEASLRGVNDPFLRLGLQLAIDGTRPEVLEEILKTEMELCTVRHRDGKSTLEQLGRYSPAFGMVGTLVGLVVMLNNMSDPASIGTGMAVALLTTLYGVVAANACFLPCAERLAVLHRNEMRGREMILRGILGIQSGEHPRLIEQRLQAFLNPGSRVRVTDHQVNVKVRRAA